MISVDYVQMMARYNAWQNGELIALTSGMADGDLSEDRGAFFGSILGTLNHLLWGDHVWMSRFDGGVPPGGGISDSPGFTPNFGAWRALREEADRRIVEWASTMSDKDLSGTLSWYSGALKADVCRPKGPLIVHFFNHQTHHRGQVHAMLTASGQRPTDTDLFAMQDMGA